jgi:hypothetical protein
VADPVIVGVLGAGTAYLCILRAAYLGDHAEEVAQSWADGREWVAARRTDVRRMWDATAPVRHPIARPVLRLVLRAHGRHRAVTA